MLFRKLNLKVAISAIATTLIAGTVFGQHHDVEFGYENGLIVIESSAAGVDAVAVFESDFDLTNPDGSQVSEEPGFASNFTEGDTTFMVTAGDSLFVGVNQSPTFGSYITYYNPVSGQFESTDATFTIEDNSPGGTDDLVISQNGLDGDLLQYITTSDGFNLDSHVDYILSSGAQAGAYGLLLNLESDNLSGDLTNPLSGNFWIVFNNGLSEDVFDGAVQHFTAVPEPATGMLIPAFLVGLLIRRRS